MNNDLYTKEQQVLRDDIYKLKKQYFDQKREYNKLQIIDARADHLSENLIEIAKRLNEERPLDFNEYIIDCSDKEAIICLADWHYGMTTDNIWNTYNTDICRQRVTKLISKTIEHLKTHKIKTLHILLLGDSAHGAIHNSCRVSAEEEVSDQLMHVAEILAESIGELSTKVSNIKVYSTYGNHLRTIQDKKDSIHSDNMEKIIPWWLRQRLQNNAKVEIIDSEFKEFIKLNVLGYNICCTHGDLDKLRDIGVTMNTIFTKLYGETIDYTISADKHHLEEFERFDIESILVRSLCGTDDYANDGRLYSTAGQTLMIFSKEDGRECTYNIKLN